MTGYFLDFEIKGEVHRFVFTTHAREQMVSRNVRDRNVLLSFNNINKDTVEALIRNGKEIIISDEKMGFSMVIDFKDALTTSEGKAIKLVTVVDKTEVFALKGTELMAI